MAQILSRSEKVDKAQQVKTQVKSFLSAAQSGDLDGLKSFIDAYIHEHSEPDFPIGPKDVSGNHGVCAL